MKNLCALSAIVSTAGIACADPILQFDVNSFHVQTTNSAGVAGAFGGLSHTGSVQFSFINSTTVLNGMFGNTSAGGPLANLGFGGSLTNFTGQITLVNGQVTGGLISIEVNGGSDVYSTQIGAGGGVSTALGGGFQIEGLAFNGAFTDSQFGNVDVSQWFNQPLVGSFLQFNWIPNQNGSGSGDMDLFVDVVPLPSAAWAGIAMLGGIMITRKLRRR